MALNKQALAVVLCFFLHCFLHSSIGECAHSEEKYHTVGIDTFRIQEESDFSNSRIPAEVVALQENGTGDADLILAYLEPPSGTSWRDMLLQGLDSDKRLVNVSSTQGRLSVNIPVKSGRELDGPEFTVTFGLGTPAQKQLMGIDTISPLSWIQCPPCKDCGSKLKLPMFVPNNSKSFRSVLCKSSKCPPLGAEPNDIQSRCDKRGICTYADINGVVQGSQGDYVTETLQVGTNTFKDFQLGCAHGFSPAREDRTSGRLGLGKGPYSLVSQKFDGQFSYCLPNYLSMRATGSLTFGKDAISPSIKVFTPLQRVPEFFSSAYLVKLEGISVGGQRLQVSLQVPGAAPTITYIDAAVLLTRFVQPVFDALRDSFEQKMMKSAPQVKPAEPFGVIEPCYQLSSLKSVKIPTISLHFNGNAKVDVPDVGTLLQVDDSRVCFAFLPSNNDAVNIIGNAQQQGLRVAFDNAKNRVGFSRQAC